MKTFYYDFHHYDVITLLSHHYKTLSQTNHYVLLRVHDNVIIFTNHYTFQSPYLQMGAIGWGQPGVVVGRVGQGWRMGWVGLVGWWATWWEQAQVGQVVGAASRRVRWYGPVCRKLCTA